MEVADLHQGLQTANVARTLRGEGVVSMAYASDHTDTQQLAAVHKVFDFRKLSEDFSLGGFLTLAMESQMAFRATSSSFYRIPLSTEIPRLVREPIWGALAVALKLQLEPTGKETRSASGGEVGRLGKIPDYSLEPLNSLYLADSSQVPMLKWDEHLLREVKGKISSVEREVIGIHFRQPEATATPFGLAFSELVRQLLKLKSFERYCFMVLGNNVPHDVAGHPRVFFAKDKGWSLEQQLVASSQTACFIGEASGFCTAAIFSDSPYLIYKDPEQHAGTVDRDIGPGGKILFATDSQFFVREIPSSQKAAMKIVTLISSSQFGSDLSRPGSGGGDSA